MWLLGSTEFLGPYAAHRRGVYAKNVDIRRGHLRASPPLAESPGLHPMGKYGLRMMVEAGLGDSQRVLQYRRCQSYP